MRVAESDSLYLTRAMRLAKLLFWFGLAALFIACPSTPDKTNFNYLRSPSFFRADTTFTDHPYCADNQPFGSKEACAAVKKYQLTWSRPEDTVNLLGYRVYLDTLDVNGGASGKPWKDIQSNPALASVIVKSHALKDTLIFAFSKTGSLNQDTMVSGQKKIFLIDSLNRSEAFSGKLVFALVPWYGGDATAGQPQFAYFKTTDKDPPDPFHPRIKPMATQIQIAWERPTDRVSFFDPSQDTGLILGYRLKITLLGSQPTALRKAFHPKLVSYAVGEKDMSAAVTDSLDNDTLPKFILFRLPDSNRSAKNTSTLLSDSLHLLIGNLRPQDTLQVFLYAIDSNGNQNDSAMEHVTVLTTDTTQPSKPVLSADSVSRNGFRVIWTSSRDTVQDGETKQEGPAYNYNIQKYLLTRILVRDSGEKTTSLDRVDTTIVPVAGDSTRDRFILPMRFLPPGMTFHLILLAVDNTGFESAVDTLTVRTDSVRFAGVDSALVCPVGFIPIPRGQFTLGDRSAAAGPDETPHMVNMAPFCIEAYEHRDATGKRFVSNVTFEQAQKACADIDHDFETELCSEAEWERSCEGPFTDSSALVHGIQSENGNPSVLQTSCNQATNDSAMAMSFDLRNSVCLTTEGVYDMAGNLSEWVRDPYVAGAYGSLTDSLLTHEFTFADSAGRDSLHTLHGLRGGNYLKTNLPLLSSTQNLARCSNRDYAQQVRPKFRTQDCVTENEVKIAVIYGPGLTGHRCISIPDDLKPASITGLIPIPNDTADTAIYAFVAQDPKPHSIPITPVDSTFKGRRIQSAVLTTRSLAVVTFLKTGTDTAIVDTLDATEMKDTSQASLAKIFQREAGNTAWTVDRTDAGYKIKFLYAYTYLGSKPAQAFYSNKAIGFRCCSLAKPVAPPIVAGSRTGP